jgi:ribonuclease HI
MGNLNYLENCVKPEIIVEKRNILSLTGYVQWDKEQQSHNAAFAFILYDDEKMIHQNVLPCKGIESVHQLELWGIKTVLPFMTEKSVVIKITQPAVINGINSDIDYWAANDWITKRGSPVKDSDLWQELYNERNQRQLIALQLEEQEVKKLRSASKAAIYRYLGI